MIKNCMVFRPASPAGVIKHIERSRLEGVTLKDLAKEAKGRNLVRIRGLSRIMTNERLRVRGSAPDATMLSYSCKLRTRKPAAAGDVAPPFIPVEVEVWLRKGSGYVVTFDAGRRLSTGATSLLSFGARGDLDSIRTLKLDKSAFLRLKDRIEGPAKSGGILRVTMQDVSLDGSRFKQIVLRAAGLGSSRLFQRSFEAAAGISNMTFLSPPPKPSSRGLLCKLSNWGGVTIYTSNPLQSEIGDLVTLIEEVAISGT